MFRLMLNPTKSRISTYLLAICFAVFCLEARAGFITTFGNGTNSFTMEFVEIGDPDNPDDPNPSASSSDVLGTPALQGKVEYEYQIGKYEVSEQMIDNFNASQSRTITIDSRGANKPATNVSWNEAARFVNWLNTSQGYQDAYKFPTDGVNDNISLWNSADAWQLGGENLFRHKDAYYFLPSVDEFFKAANYDPASGTYFDYPTQAGYAPNPVASGTDPNTAVYSQGSSGGPADITQAGGLNQNGTMGQGGNVWEWEESQGWKEWTAEFYENIIPSYRRGFRGGGWTSDGFQYLSPYRSTKFPEDSSYSLGFRVATIGVPEPSTMILALVGLLALATGRWNR